jgi:sulfatase maturation enzyme AslB (radical SAM superfamily)
MKLSTILSVIGKNLKIWSYKLIGKSDRLVPYKLLISLTNRCNSRCIYCDIWELDKKNPEILKNEITLKDITKTFQDMGKHLVWLSLSGGEVTLVPYFKEMIQAAKEHCPNLKIVTFTTNALAPRRALDYARFIKDQGFDCFITISLDGDEETHDLFRGIPGNYKKCLTLYDALKKNNIGTYFGITVSDQNLSFIENHYKDWNQTIKSITFVHDGGIYAKGNALDYDKVYRGMSLINRHYVLAEISEIIEKIHIKISLFFLRQGRTKNLVPCEVLNASVHVMPDGSITPCMYMPSLGNIKNDRLSEACTGPEAMRMRSEIKQDRCPHCWMNCYSPHSIMQHPFASLRYLFKKEI